MASAKKSGRVASRAYHHGELKTALVQATDDILRERGIEGFSLRDAARRAGVSPGAPAHHFGNGAGLLTEVALLGYRALKESLDKADLGGSPASQLRALVTRYVIFALDHPGRFRLMFRKDLINRDDPRYREASETALMSFADAAAGHAGTTKKKMFDSQEFGPILAVWASAHGIAHLALEDKMAALARGKDARQDFIERLLPSILAAQWPYSNKK